MAIEEFIQAFSVVLVIAVLVATVGWVLLLWCGTGDAAQDAQRRRRARRILLVTVIGAGCVVGGVHLLLRVKRAYDLRHLDAWITPALAEFATIPADAQERRDALYPDLIDRILERYAGRAPLLAEAFSRLAEFAYGSGDYKWAVDAYLRDAGPGRGEEWSLCSDKNIRSVIRCARSAYEVGIIAEANNRLSWAIHVLRDPMGRTETDPLFVEAAEHAGRSLELTRHLQRAEREYRSASDKFAVLYGMDSPEALRNRLNLVRVLRRCGKEDEAREVADAIRLDADGAEPESRRFRIELALERSMLAALSGDGARGSELLAGARREHRAVFGDVTGCHFALALAIRAAEARYVLGDVSGAVAELTALEPRLPPSGPKASWPGGIVYLARDTHGIWTSGPGGQAQTISNPLPLGAVPIGTLELELRFLLARALKDAGRPAEAVVELQRIADAVCGELRYRWADADLAVGLAGTLTGRDGSKAVEHLLLTMLGQDAPGERSERERGHAPVQDADRQVIRERAERLLRVLEGVYAAGKNTAKANACRSRLAELKAEAADAANQAEE